MLRRRIAEHLKARDWTVIGLDLIVVVVGVFVSIQLGNWNTASNQRAVEDAYLERLRDDIASNRGRLDLFMASGERRMNVIYRVEEMYFGESGVQSLNEAEGAFFADSYITALPPIEMPSVSEAFTGGKIDLISDPDLVNRLIVIEQSEDRIRNVVEAVSESIPVYERDFPKLVTRMRAKEPVTDPRDDALSSPYHKGARCHFLDQQPEPEFLTALASTTKLNETYLTLLNQHIGKLDELEEVLSKAMGK